MMTYDPTAYKRERAANAARLDAVVAEIAANLPAGWTPEPRRDDDNENGAGLAGPDDQRLWIWRNSDKLEISGRYPDGARDVYGVEYVKIGASMSQSGDVGAKIAKNIERRLLPKYQEELAKAKEGIARANNAAQQREAAAAALREAGLTEYGSHNPGTLGLPHQAPGYGTIELGHDGSTGRIDVGSIPFDALVRIAAILAEKDPK